VTIRTDTMVARIEVLEAVGTACAWQPLCWTRSLDLGEMVVGADGCSPAVEGTDALVGDAGIAGWVWGRRGQQRN